MNLCCDTFTNLGCFSSCAPLDTGIVATQTGDHIIYLQFGNGVQKIIAAATIGNNIIIEPAINENYTFKMKIINPDDSVLGCYRFSTKFVQTLSS